MDSQSLIYSSNTLADSDQIVFRLEKFSYATSLTNAIRHLWTHESSQGLLRLVMTRPKIGLSIAQVGHNSMRVESGLNAMEIVDLNSLVHMTNRYRQLNTNAGAESPVYAAIKMPCVAVRYPASPTTVRRIQLKFSNELDFHQVVGLLRELNLEIRDHGLSKGTTTIMSREKIAPTVNDVGLPPTIMTPSSMISRTPTASPFFNRPDRTMGSPSTWIANNQTIPYAVATLSHSLKATNSGPPSMPIPSATLTEHDPNSYAQFQTDQIPSIDPKTFEAIGMRRSLNQIALHTQRSHQDYHGEQPQRSYSSISPSTMIPESSPLYIERSATNAAPQNSKSCERRVPLPFESVRPNSAPVSSNASNLKALVPPMRELPFPQKNSATPRPKSATTERQATVNAIQKTKPTSRKTPSKALERPPILPPPQMLKRIANRNASSIVQPAKGNANAPQKSPVTDSTAIETRLRANSPNEVESPLAAKSANIARQSNQHGLASKAVPTAVIPQKRSWVDQNVESTVKTVKRMVNASTQTQTLSGRNHTSGMILTTISADERSISDPLDQNSSGDLQASFMDEIDKFVRKHKHRPPPMEIWEQPGYDTASEDERRKIINDFICENLESDDFIKLISDVGSVWQRIGLQM